MFLIRDLVASRTWLALINHLAGLVAGMVASTFVVAALASGLSLLAAALTGVVVLGLTLRFADWFGHFERARFSFLLGARIPAWPAEGRAGYRWHVVPRLNTLTERASWSEIGYALLRLPVSMGTSVRERCVVPTGPGCGFDATLTVPHGTNVALSSGGGGLNVAGDGLVVPRLEISSTAGDITVRLASVPRDLEVSDRAGDIHIVLPRSIATYRLDAHSAAGDVNDGGIPQSQSSPNMITVTDEAGDITVSEAS
jgi:putative sensor protein/putative adhesin